jgi:hypothetical protein
MAVGGVGVEERPVVRAIVVRESPPEDLRDVIRELLIGMRAPHAPLRNDEIAAVHVQTSVFEAMGFSIA